MIIFITAVKQRSNITNKLQSYSLLAADSRHSPSRMCRWVRNSLVAWKATRTTPMRWKLHKEHSNRKTGLPLIPHTTVVNQPQNGSKTAYQRSNTSAPTLAMVIVDAVIWLLYSKQQGLTATGTVLFCLFIVCINLTAMYGRSPKVCEPWQEVGGSFQGRLFCYLSLQVTLCKLMQRDRKPILTSTSHFHTTTNETSKHGLNQIPATILTEGHTEPNTGWRWPSRSAAAAWSPPESNSTQKMRKRRSPDSTFQTIHPSTLLLQRKQKLFTAACAPDSYNTGVYQTQTLVRRWTGHPETSSWRPKYNHTKLQRKC